MKNKKHKLTKKLFGFMKTKKQVKSAYEAPYYSSYLNTMGKAVWSVREYGKFADEGYVKNVIAHRCISIIASGAASVPFRLSRLIDGVRNEISEHRLLNLLNSPNPCIGRSDFFETIYSHKLIGGNAYIQLIKDSNNLPVELFALRPDRISIIAGNGCVPQGYRYEVNGTEKDFRVDRITGRSDILHLKKFHPLNDWYGLSSIEAAAYSIDQHNEASAWNQALLQNGARPSGALIVKTGENGEGEYLSEEQYVRVKNQMEDVYSGSANAGRPMLLEGGLEWKEMSISPKDMDLSIQNIALQEILHWLLECLRSS